MSNQIRSAYKKTHIKRRPSRLRRIVAYLQTSVLLLFGIGLGVVVAVFIDVSGEIPKVTAGYTPPEATKIFSSDNVLLDTIGPENREFVSREHIPKNLLNATVAIEDRRFFEHSGVDFKGIARAIVTNVRGRSMTQGGSTITQQLARCVYLNQSKTFNRKAKEAVLAVMIERNYPKNKILELYLNQVFYGSNAFGVEAASKVYFGKSVDKLDLEECALLAGLPQRPSSLSPHVNLEGALHRRDRVLDKMTEEGYITVEERDRAKSKIPHIVPRKPAKYRSKAPYFTDYVKRYLRDKYEYGDDLIYRGGLRIYTTLNYRMQLEAEEALAEGIKKARRAGRMSKTQGNGALLCIDPTNGYIRAMVGGEDYTKSEYNRADQAKRQPGSSFKLFVYTAAVDRLGWNANHTVEGGRFRDPRWPNWRPKNYDGRWPGNMSMKRAVANSVNIPAIKTAVNEVGLDEVVRYARMMGVKSELKPYPAIAIGGIGGVSVLDMTAAYGVIASGGYYIEPTPILRVENSQGQTLDEQLDKGRQILSDRTVGVMDELFRAVVTSGTARSVLRSFPNARGKTGTTNEDADAWFIGYIPKKLVTAVWMGNDNHTPMRHVFGGTVCGPVWRDFMGEAVKINDEVNKPKPTVKHTPKIESNNSQPAGESNTNVNEDPSQATENNTDEPETPSGTVRVNICNDSSLLATESCPSHEETFVEGTQPTRYCNIHHNSNTSGRSDDGLRMTPPPPILTDR